jgi:UDP-glucose 4-epimerase
MARILVTGGAGFIGSHLVEALVARGDQVRVLDDFSSGKRANLAAVAGLMEIVEGGLLDPVLKEAVEDIELVFHEAAFVSVPASLERPADCYASNVQGTTELFEAAREAGVGRVILASSAAVYGGREEMPLSEDDSTECISPYASSKLFNENLAALYTASLGLPAVALRYFNVYGPRQAPDSDYAAVIPRFIERLAAGKAPHIHGDGRQSRDFVFVGDVVRANLLAAAAKDAPGRAFNVCSGRETSLLDLAEVLGRLFPDAPPADFGDPRPGDVPKSLGDPNLAAKVLGFRAQTELADGLQSIVESALA